MIIPMLFDASQLNLFAIKTVRLNLSYQGVKDVEEVIDYPIHITTLTQRYFGQILYQQGLIFENLDRTQNALQKYSEALGQNHLDTLVVFRIGQLYERLGRREEALKFWQMDGEIISKYFITQGTWNTQNGNWQQANIEFRRSVSIDPNNYLGYLGLGTVSRVLEDWDSAIDAYIKVLSIAPDDLDANYNLGVAYLKKGEYSASREKARKVLAIYPQYIWAYILMGDSYRLESKYDQAEEWYKKVVEMDDYKSLGLRYLGINSLAGHDAITAISYFEQALKLSFEPELFFWLGQAYVQQQDYENALAQFQMATRLAPENYSFHLALADSYYSLGQKEDAILEYRRVLELSPGSIEAESRLNQLTNGS